MPVMNRNDVTISWVNPDATETELAPGPGTFSIDGLEEGQREAIPVYNNGEFLELIRGDRLPVTGTITVHQDGNMTDPTTAKPFDILMHFGAQSAKVTQDPGGLVWTGDLKVVGSRGAYSFTLILPNCRIQGAWSKAKEGNAWELSYTSYPSATDRISLDGSNVHDA